jgi:predicted outer membrane repeat protein
MALSLYRRPALERRKIMLLSSWLRNGKRPAPAACRRPPTSPRQGAGFRPRLEALEDRWLPSTLSVTSIKDSASGSLRAVIAAAHSGDTIVFSSKLDGKTITLTSGELDLTKNLTIQGPGAGQLTISGNSANWYSDYSTLRNTYASRVFEVAQNATVTLSGLTISNGDGLAGYTLGKHPSDYEGGGILDHGTLTLSGCTISNNHADHTGGGIYSDGTLTVNGCTISGNHAISGAGIANWGAATFVSTIISSNIADWVDGAYQPHGTGGGISNNGTLTLSGCTVSGNLANYEGSGIYNDTSGTVTVENSSSISGDNATAVNLGVLYLDGTSTIENVIGNPAILI